MKRYVGYLYLAPAIILLGVFVFYPLIYTIYLSFLTGIWWPPLKNLLALPTM